MGHKYGYVLIDSSAASPHYCVRHPSNSCWVIAFLVKMASLSVFKLLVVALLLSTLLSVDCSARLNSKRQKRVPIKPSSKGNNKFSNVNLPTDTSTVGFDTVASLNQTVLTCLVAQASVATFQAVNGLDIVAAVNATAAAARSAGFTTVDALLSPCPLCSVNATAQASRFAQYVTKSKLSVDNYWVPTLVVLRILRVVCTRLLELTLLVALTQRTPVLIPREVLIPPILERTLLADPTLLDTAVLTAAATVDTAVEDTAAVTAVTVVVVTAVEATVVTAVEVIVAGAIAVEVIVAEAIAVEDSAATLINKLTAFLLQ